MRAYSIFTFNSQQLLFPSSLIIFSLRLLTTNCAQGAWSNRKM